MKALTSALLIGLALVLLLVASASAQTPPSHPSDPAAVLIGTFQTSITVSSSGTLSLGSARVGSVTASSAAEECQIKANVSVWRTSTGAIDYIVDASSIVYVGSCGNIGLTTSDVFSQLGRAGLRQGIQMGFSPCDSNCSASQSSRVYSALCVQRTGSGQMTHFEPCSMSSYCYREYSYCCPNGTSTPQITEIPRIGEGCGVGTPGFCEPTCAPGSGGKTVQ